MIFREAQLSDATSIAQLHTESWQQSYRGILTDEYLDIHLANNRQQLWQERLSKPQPNQKIIVAEQGSILYGFACSYFAHDPTFGTLLDNLHVQPLHKGQGIGAELMKLTMRWLQEKTDGNNLYLWVYERNIAAKKFYERMGGQCVETTIITNTDGSVSNICRYVWLFWNEDNTIKSKIMPHMALLNTRL